MELWWILHPLLTRQVLFSIVAYQISSNRCPDYRPERTWRIWMELWWILLPLLTRQVLFTMVAYRISSNRYPDYRFGARLRRVVARAFTVQVKNVERGALRQG